MICEVPLTRVLTVISFTTAFAKHGIVGRGVLIDFYGYSQEQGKEYDPLSGYARLYLKRRLITN